MYVSLLPLICISQIVFMDYLLIKNVLILCPCLYVHFPWLALFLCSAISMFSSGHSLCLNFAGKTSFFRECFLKLSQ